MPRLDGSNYEIWNARITATLDGKGLLSYVLEKDFVEDSDSEDEAKVAPPATVPIQSHCHRHHRRRYGRANGRSDG